MQKIDDNLSLFLEIFLRNIFKIHTLLEIIMAWFKSKEEKEHEKQEKEANEFESKKEKERERREKEAKEFAQKLRDEQEKAYDAALNQIVITPERQENYERRMGYAVEVIDTGEQNKGIILNSYPGSLHLNGNFRLKKRIVEAGIEAIVDTSYSKTEFYDFFYGLPVARKKGGPYR